MSFGLSRLFQSPLRALAGFAAPVSRQIHHITGFNPTLGTCTVQYASQNLPSLQVNAASPHMIAGGAWSLIATRFWRRIIFFKEQKRLRKFSWKVRMSTEKGRTIIMKRMLKGKITYSH